jgi:YVTN family beta-propeller protein
MKPRSLRRALMVSALTLVVVLSGLRPTIALAAQLCGGLLYPFPFIDVAGESLPFCTSILELYVTGISKGTSATTFSPTATVTRDQMAAFLQRSLDQGVQRGSRRAALDQWWTPKNLSAMQVIDLGGTGPALCKSDGERIWIAAGNVIKAVWASTGEVQSDVFFVAGGDREAVLVAAGRIFVANRNGTLDVVTPSFLADPPYIITQTTTVTFHPYGMAFDGANVWTANYTDGTVTKVALPCCSSQTTVGGFTRTVGLVYDGANIWVTDSAANKLHKLNADGTIALTVPVGGGPTFPAFDGANIWVPNSGDDSITVVRADTGAIVATIPADASNKLSDPIQVAFDGERILVTNYTSDSVTLYRAANMSFISNVSLGAGSHPFGVCSDGTNFWVTLNGTHQLVRF